MPTILIVQGFRFFFWSNENEEPMHVHVEKGGAEGKIWLTPTVKLAYMHGFNSRQKKIIMEIIIANISTFKQKWNEYFG